MKGLIIADFNIDNLALLLKRGPGEQVFEMVIAPMMPVRATLLDGNAGYWKGADFGVVWSRPESCLETFNEILGGKGWTVEQLDSEIDQFAESIQQASKRVRTVFVVTWALNPLLFPRGLTDLYQGGAGRALLRANLRLAERLDSISNAYLLNSERWLQAAAPQPWDARLWYLGKIPFSTPVFKEAAREISSGLVGLAGKARKVLVLDLDDTLWGGIVGDAGWENLKLGGHDPIGEAFVDFQRRLKGLASRGVILAIVSKNEEEVALTAIDKHPEMVLRRTDFAGWRINWQDKAQNVLELVRSLNLGLDSAVFIDDNPIERARVREALPEVIVPEWPEDKRLYSSALMALDCFNQPSLTEEDRARTTMYVSERERSELRTSAGSLEEWLATLDIVVTVEALNITNLARATQLLNKTNQLNLATRRLSEAELLKWISSRGHQLWTIRVRDKLGDSGLTGIISLDCDNENVRIVDFLLSCRVMGRKVEETMLHVAIAWARAAGFRELAARYEETPKNAPCLEFFRRSGLKEDAPSKFSWDLSTSYPLPAQVRLESAKPSVVADEAAMAGLISK